MSETSRRHVRRSRTEWQQLIEEQARSGLTQKVFCSSRGISVTSFCHWKRRLAAEPTPEPGPEPWVELGALAGGAEPRGWDLELELGDGLCLRLRRC